MRIWIDALTPKQVLFTEPLVDELKKLDHLVYVTSRHYREVESLFKKSPFDVFFVGKHGGGLLYDKLLASSERVHKLAELVNRWEPELSIHFGSPEGARVAFGLKVPQICIHDSPHSESVNRLTLPLVDHLVTPSVIPYNAWKNYSFMRKNITRYEAIDPAAWLKRRKVERVKINEFGADPNKRTITVRYEESYASYLLDKDKEWGTKVIDALSSKFPEYNLIVLSRYEDQIMRLAEKYGDKVIIPKNIVDGASLLKSSDLFVGMGGTMTEEAALLGVPTISVFQGANLYYISYLVKEGLVVKSKSIDHLLKAADTLLTDEVVRKQISERARRTLQKMEDPVKIVLSVVAQFKKS